MSADIREDVRERYAAAALSVDVDPVQHTSGCGCGSCCGSSCCTSDSAVWGEGLYDEASRMEVSERVLQSSLGCGNPTAVADLNEGDVVLDLGSGGGLDVLLSARRVGPSGKAYGLDMTDEMLALARENQAKAAIGNAEFVKGYIEDVPLPAESIDVVISNCVVNLSPDKARVLQETFRVLRPGGRLAITDVVAESPVEDDGVRDVDRWSSCVAGAITRQQYEDGLAEAGFADVQIIDSHEVEEGYTSVVVRARKPRVGAT